MSAILFLLVAKYLLLLACHFLGDYGLQNAWMATMKGKEWHPLLAHVVTYTAVFALFLHLSPFFHFSSWIVLFVACSHLLIDICKSRLNLFSDATDQGLHFVCMGVVLAMGFI